MCLVIFITLVKMTIVEQDTEVCHVSKTFYGFKYNQKLLFTFLITEQHLLLVVVVFLQRDYMYLEKTQNFPSTWPSLKKPNRLNWRIFNI